MTYAIIIIAYLVLNLLVSYVNVYTEAGFSSICMYWKNISIDRKCLHRFRGNNKGERRYKISLCKVCFLARKDKQRDREPSPFWPFCWPKRRIFLPFHILQLVKSLLFLYLKPKKGTPFARSTCHLRNEHSYLMHTLARVRKLDVPSMIVKKNWMNSFSSGRFEVYKIKPYKNNDLKKNPFSWLKNSVHVEPVWFSLDNLTLCGRPNYSSTILHSIKENFRCAEAFLLRTGRFFYCFPQKLRKKKQTKFR